MYDVLTIGSAIVDTFIKSSEFHIQPGSDGGFICQKYGDKIEVDDFVMCTGGGGGNTATGFARLGFSVAVIAETGTDVLAKIVHDDLVKEHVSTSWMVAQKQEKTGGSVILVGANGGRTVLVHRGAAAQLDPSDIPNHILAHSKWIHMSSIAGRVDTLSHIFSLVAQHKTRLSWNPGKQEIEALIAGEVPSTVFDTCTVLFVNETEWELLKPLQSLIKNATVVVVTEGPKGGVVLSQENSYRYTPNDKKVVDETGAGDAFCCGFVAAVMRGADIPTACEWGVRNSESVIGFFGAKPGLLTSSVLHR